MPEITKDVSAFAQQLMDAAGISDATQKEQLAAIFNNDKVKAVLTPVLTEATDGIARERGRVAAESAKAKEATDKMTAYYNDGLSLAARNKAVVDEATAKVTQYEALYGTLPGGGDPNDPNARRAAVADVIDKKTFTDRIAQTENTTVGLAKSVMKITAKHLREFPDLELDPDAITKIATEQNLSAEKAWEVFTQPARQAKEAARVEAEKIAYADAKITEMNTRSAMSSVVDSAPRSEFIQNVVKQAPPDSALEGFRKGWNDPNAGATMAKEFGGR